MVVKYRPLEPDGWRLRLVDHFTENCCNAGAWSKRKLQRDGLDIQKEVAFYLMRKIIKPVQSKGDVSSACRRVRAKRAHRHLLAFAFMVSGVMMIANQNSAPFGAVGAMWAWHRIANLIMICCRQFMMLPLMKYVDDFFAINRDGS